MFFLFEIWAHRRASRLKQLERSERINKLPPKYHESITPYESEILAMPASKVVSSVQGGTLEPQDVLLAYSKKALLAHTQTNCLTEVMISSAERWAVTCNKSGPLAGMPISMKDTVGVAGYDSTAGYSSWAFKPFTRDSPFIRLILDAGGVPFVKTNVPITLLSFESFSDLWGRSRNPHVPTHSPGGSTGGEAALLAYGGSRLGLGTDVAGSVRIPAHYSGIYTVKASSGRFMKAGNASGMVGQEGVPPVYSPMTQSLEDLEMFWKAVTSMKPWEYDGSCVPIPWRSVTLSPQLRVGVLWDDGIVSPSPACKRALESVVFALTQAGHEVFAIDPPSPYEALHIGSQLMANAFLAAASHIRPGERNDPGAAQGLRALHLSRFTRHLWALYVRYVRRDPLYANLIRDFRPQTGLEFYARIGEREAYKARWHAFWREHNLDFVLTVPNALPAIRHGDSKDQWMSCGYTFLFNVLDYSAGVLPVMKVDRHVDGVVPGSFRPRNTIEAKAHAGYDADTMHGLPVGVQIVGQRFEEEKVIEGMKLVQHLLVEQGKAYASFGDIKL